MNKAILSGIFALGLAGCAAMGPNKGLTTLEQAVHTQTPHILSVEDVDKTFPFYSSLKKWGIKVELKNPVTLSEEGVKKVYDKSNDPMSGILRGVKAYRNGFYCSQKCFIPKGKKFAFAIGDGGVFASQAIQVMDKKDINVYMGSIKKEDGNTGPKRCTVMLSKDDVAVGINMYYSEPGTTEFWNYVGKVKDSGFKVDYKSQGCRPLKALK